MKQAKHVGSSVPRAESVEKVTGKAVYAVDVTLPEMLWGKVLRSPIAHGRIKRIDANKALAVPGVKALVTGADVTGVRIGRQLYDMPILADGVVRFIGEKVAAVAAEVARRSQSRPWSSSKSNMKSLPPLLDPVGAMAPGATLLRPQVMAYRGLPGQLTGAEQRLCPIVLEKGRTSKKAFAAPTGSLKILFHTPVRAPGLHRAAFLRCQRPTNPAAQKSGLAAKCPSRCAIS